MNYCSVVGTATAYGLDDRGVELRVSVGSKIFTSAYRPNRLWGPPNLVYKGYRFNVTSTGNAGCFKKSFITFKAYTNLFGGNVQCFELP
jgi:predicted porin